MKDFYDQEVLSRTLPFDGKTLSEAILKTFRKRGTELPASGTPFAFTPSFMMTREGGKVAVSN
jgi:hypothetical protein